LDDFGREELSSEQGSSQDFSWKGFLRLNFLIALQRLDKIIVVFLGVKLPKIFKT
jgi:hypothetical protein